MKKEVGMYQLYVWAEHSNGTQYIKVLMEGTYLQVYNERHRLIDEGCNPIDLLITRLNTEL